MDLALQLIVVGISQAAVYCLVATGFGLILSVTHVFHFAHAALFAAAGFFVYALAEQAGLSLALAIPLATVGAVGMALAIQFFVYEPLRAKGAAQFTVILASIGLQFAIENLLALTWGTGGRNIPNPFAQVSYALGGVVITPTDTGCDPVQGELVMALRDELAIRRFDDRVGELIVHFPRLGFEMKKAT